MGPPVRVVCDACLQSLDVSSEEAAAGSPSCPYCGNPIENRSYDPDIPTGEHTPTASPSALSDGPTLRVAPSSDARRIGRFVLGEPLGEGGYGQVFRAYDPRLDRDVALKILKTTRLDEKAIERFYREARAAARLDHPNIVGLHDAGRDDGRCWIAYQLISGRTLSLIRDVERPSISEAARIVRDLALALDHAHSRGVFHRDLKPANVMIDDSGRTRLTDFGLARRGDLDSDLTREGTVLGTPQYMSPEAAAGRSNQADARSDVYSLGVILYELICGRKPVDLPSGAPPWRFRPSPTPPTPRSVDRAIPAGLDRVCMKALAFNPEDRYPDARSLAEALSRFVGPPPKPRPATVEHAPEPVAPDPEPAPGRRLPRIVGAAVATSVLGLALALGLRSGGDSRAVPSPPAPQAAHGAAIVDAGPARTGPSPAPPSSPPADVTPAPAAKTDGPGAAEVAADPAPVPPPVVTPTPARKVIGNRNKKTFHRPGCPALSITHERHQTEFADAGAAEAEGYLPCGRCKPTQAVAPPGIPHQD